MEAGRQEKQMGGAGRDSQAGREREAGLLPVTSP